MKRYLTYLIYLIVLLIFPFIAVANTPVTIKVGVYENFPKIFTDKESIVTGFWPDLIQYISTKEGWQINWVPGTWTQGLKRLETGEINIMPDTGWTEPRSRKYTFSDETVLVSWSRLYVSKNSKIKSIVDLSGKTIAALKGSFNLEGPEGLRQILYKFNLKATIKEMESYEDIFDALQGKKIDAGITNKDFGNHHEADYDIQRTAIIFQPARMQFAFTKDADLTPFLIQKIDAHMKHLKKDKSSLYYQILEKYIGGKRTETFIEIIPIWIKTISIVACIVILFLFAVGIASRIQVRRRTCELRGSEEKYRTLINNSPDLRYRTDTEGKIIFISPSVYKLSGYTTQEAVGMKMAEEIYAFPDERETFLAMLQKKGYVSDFEAQLKRKDGSIWWASTNALFNKDHNGNILGIEGVTRDITDRKKSEDALRESEKKYRHLFQNAPAGIYEIDFEKVKFINVNEVMCKYSGYSEEEFLSMNPLDLLTEDSKNLFIERLEKFSTGKNQVSGIEYNIITKDGQEFCVILNNDYIYKNGKLTGSRVVVHDISELKQAQEEKIKAQQIAGEQKKLALVGQVAGKMAHDFNNILSIIMGNTELSLIDCKDEETKKTLELVLEQTIRGKNLTRNLVAFAKDQEPKQEFFRINEKIDLVLNLMKKDLQGVELIREDKAGVPDLLADPGMI